MPTPAVTTYDFDQVTCTVGAILLDGFMKGTSIQVEYEEATFTHVVGDDGKVCRSKTLNPVMKCTVTLMQSSASNDKLSALLALDRNAPNGAGIVPFLLVDRNGRTEASASQCWIAKGADIMFDQECVARTWEITLADAVPFVGGN